MYEKFKDPILPRRAFVVRLIRNTIFCTVLFVAWLVLGMYGYKTFANTSWLDSFHQAALVFSGVDSIVPMQTEASKLFEGIYAMLGSFAIFILVTILLAPIVHRFMHRHHLGK